MSETLNKNNSSSTGKYDKGRAIKKTQDDKIKLNLNPDPIKTLEADFQGICLESHAKGKTSVKSTPKKTNVKPKPELNSVTPNLGKTNVTSGLIKNNVTSSETSLVAKSTRVVNMPVDDVDYSILGKHFSIFNAYFKGKLLLFLMGLLQSCLWAKNWPPELLYLLYGFMFFLKAFVTVERESWILESSIKMGLTSIFR